jgi:ankyrin repeat protein
VAAASGDIVEVRRLLFKGADVNVQPKGMNGGTPLIQATMHQRDDVVFELLERGADPNLTDHAGLTALSWAVSQGDSATNVIRMLVQHGAKVEPNMMSQAIHDGQPAVALMLMEVRPKK